MFLVEDEDSVTSQERDSLPCSSASNPLARCSPVATVYLGCSGSVWNEFVIAVTFLQNDSNITAIVKFYNLTGQYSTDWGEMLAAAVTIVLPVVLVFVFLQRRFIDGMTAGAVKS